SDYGHRSRWSVRFGVTVSFLGDGTVSGHIVLSIVGLPGLVAGLIWLTVKEPPRRSPPEARQLVPATAPLWRKLLAFMGLDAALAIWKRKYVFLPLFVALAMSATESQGLPQFRTPFILRTY